MPELRESKLSEDGPRVPFLPQARLSPLGFLILIIIAASFSAGRQRQELALSLLGLILLSVWMYCLILGFLMALVHRKKAFLIQPRISPRSISAGMSVELLHQGGLRFLRVPGILYRCRLCLETKDGRRVEHVFDPALPGASLDIPLRGAYYQGDDELRILDALNVFTFSWPLRREAEVRVLASPRPSEEAAPVKPRSGAQDRRSGSHYLRGDELVDHRPYIPGDDPRRINWKLYSHGPSNSLFVREGEPEPPPHSRLLILVDTETDGTLYRAGEGREAVDLLCAQALALARDLVGRGMDVLTGYTGGEIRVGEDPAQGLAWPASLPLHGPAELPSPDRGTCILALPRSSVGEAALDRFLKRLSSQPLPCDMLFLYPEQGPAPVREAAETCARLYGGRSGLRAQALAVPDAPGAGGTP